MSNDTDKNPFSQILDYNHVVLAGLDIANIALFMQQTYLTNIQISNALRAMNKDGKLDKHLKDVREGIDEQIRHYDEFITELAERMKAREK